MVMSDISLERVTKAVHDCLVRGAESGKIDAALNFEVKDLSLRRDPGEDDLPLEELRLVLRYWQALSKTDGVADLLKIDPHALRRALGYVMLIDVGSGESEFRYALYGSKIAAVAGFDMTGKTVWQVATTSAIQTFFAACYRVVRAERCTLYTVHKAPPQITASHWHRLILPLGQGGEVKRFLVCNTPIQNRQLV
jgi:hypothetical protein